MRRTAWLPTIFGLFALAAAPAAASPDVAYGPEMFTLTTADQATFAATFDSDTAGPFVLFVRNGDDEGARVDGAVVDVNGAPTVVAGALTSDLPGLHTQIELLEGTNEITVELTGSAGTFVTVAVARPGHLPVLTAGRLLLPWGRDDDEAALQIALRNGSQRFPRGVHVVFYRPDGSVAGASEPLRLPPRGSLRLPVGAWIGAGSWDRGSIAVFYAGPGVARVFGTAHQLDRGTGLWNLEPLQPAGQDVFRHRPDGRDARLTQRSGR